MMQKLLNIARLRTNLMLARMKDSYLAHGARFIIHLVSQLRARPGEWSAVVASRIAKSINNIRLGMPKNLKEWATFIIYHAKDIVRSIVQRVHLVVLLCFWTVIFYIYFRIRWLRRAVHPYPPYPLEGLLDSPRAVLMAVCFPQELQFILELINSADSYGAIDESRLSLSFQEILNDCTLIRIYYLRARVVFWEADRYAARRDAEGVHPDYDPHQSKWQWFSGAQPSSPQNGGDHSDD